MKDKYCRCCGRLLDEKIDNNNEIYMYCNSCDKRYYENAICAIICAIKYQDKYLVVKQPHINDSYSLISGFVNINESLEECVKREIKEEFNLDIEVKEYLGKVEDEKNIGYIYNAKILGGSFKLGGEELDHNTEDNYYEVPDQHMQVDKDILIKGNKIYSPDTCAIIPQYINTLFIRNNRKRGQYPVGVYYNKRAKKYEAMYKINGKNKHIGYYTSVDDAFLAYKEYKEDHIKQIADEYFSNGYITEQVYNAMYAWEVEPTD